ncbi:MAG: DJ-1/PfpI family protein [Acidimicrobiales bacterium]
MQIAFVLYEGLTTLDIVGPYEVLVRLPGASGVFVAGEAGAITADTGILSLTATASFSDVPKPDIVVVPGGTSGTDVAMKDERLLSWLQDVAPTTTWMTSVCTGSLILASAGLLKGIPATTHWGAMDRLGDLGAVATKQRVIIGDGIATAAGVSAGIDMALTLAAEIAGADYARALQLGIEYGPHPPFDAGSPEKAGEELTALVQAVSR